MVRRCIAFVLTVLLGRALLAQSPVPSGPEFRVNTYTTGNQREPTVIVDASGRFVVAWTDGRADGSGYGVMGRRFSAGGASLGPGFRINAHTTGLQAAVSLSADADGRFTAGFADLDLGRTVARRFDASGQPIGGDIVVKNGAVVPRLDGTPDGGFIALWSEFTSPNNTLVLGQRFDSSGAAQGGEFQVNTMTSGFQAYPAMASAPDGRFVVAWVASDGSQYGVHAQRFDAAGARAGGEFLVNTYTTGYQRWFLGNHDHVVAMADDGSFVVTWTSYQPPSGDDDVFAQRFDASGHRVGGEFRPSTTTLLDQSEPRIAMDGGGDFVIAWSSSYGGTDVVGRRFDAAGNARGPEFRINSFTTGAQFFPSVDSDPAGNFVVTWVGYPQDGSGSGVYARRFGGLLPAALAVDGAGNGVLEPGETVTLAPSWRNVNGLAQTFTGSLTSLTGPAGGTYAVTDAAADYGTVANSATGSCGPNCYGLTVSGTRPGAHWDASAAEAISPDTQGQHKAWRLHLGDSFADVPRSSPYYRFVETLLHRGVTAGCTATTYCPAASTTREQMAAFTLVAREGPGYKPPACTAPLFDDVPASSPFCRWIEELARRGAVSGCGEGSYCPGAAVTREQMAAIVLRALDPFLTPPTCTTPMFPDVPASSPFCRWVEELARRGIVGGCGGGLYCPAAAVTREQMGVFLGSTFGLSLYGP